MSKKRVAAPASDDFTGKPYKEKQYVFSDKENREHVDLKEYEETIMSIVTEVIPGAAVEVESNGYIIRTPEGHISNGAVRAIGRKLAQTPLNKFVLYKPSLFIGIPGKKTRRKQRAKTKKRLNNRHPAAWPVGSRGLFLIFELYC